MTNIAIIKDAVIVLFLNSMDEQFYLIIRLLNPNLIDEMEGDIKNYTLRMAPNELSEVMVIDIISNDNGEDDSNNSNHINGENVSNNSNQILEEESGKKTSQEMNMNELGNNRLDNSKQLNETQNSQMKNLFEAEIADFKLSCQAEL